MSARLSMPVQSRDVTMRSADRRLHAIGTSCSTARRRSALTSASCAWDASGSQKNTTRSSSRFAIILDGGPTTVGRASTVVDASSEPITVLREGAISKAQIEEALLGVETYS